MAAEQASWAEKLFSSLRYADYRDLWTSTMFTQMAFSMTSLVLDWYMLELTGSALWVALVAFAAGMPMLVWSPITGILADRLERRRIMGAAMLLAAGGVAVVAVLVHWQRVQPWHLVGLAFLMGSSFSLFAPARSALLANLVPGHLVANATVFQYSSSRVVSFVGPVLAGALVARVAVAPTLLMAVVLFVVTAWQYQRLAGAGVTPTGAFTVYSLRQDLRAVIPYIRANREVFELVLLGLIVVPVGMNYQHLMPVFARDVLHVGPAVLGVLVGMGFLGTALIGFVLTLVGRLHSGPAVLGSALFSGLGLALLALCDKPVLAVGLLLLLGLVNGVFLSLTTILVQMIPPEAVRGRLLGIWGAVWGVVPFGALGTGSIADFFGVRAALIAGGLVCAVWSAWLIFSGRHLRQLA
jgi:MFS family permease